MTLACRDGEQAAAIGETGRNPRYMQDVHLGDIEAAAIEAAPLAVAELIVLAVPSAAFSAVVDCCRATRRCSP